MKVGGLQRGGGRGVGAAELVATPGGGVVVKGCLSRW